MSSVVLCFDYNCDPKSYPHSSVIFEWQQLVQTFSMDPSRNLIEFYEKSTGTNVPRGLVLRVLGCTNEHSSTCLEIECSTEHDYMAFGTALVSAINRFFECDGVFDVVVKS